MHAIFFVIVQKFSFYLYVIFVCVRVCVCFFMTNFKKKLWTGFFVWLFKRRLSSQLAIQTLDVCFRSAAYTSLDPAFATEIKHQVIGFRLTADQCFSAS